MAKKILKAKDIEALENTQPVSIGYGLTGTETMNCPTLNTCDGTYNCPTIATCTTFTGACAVATLDRSCITTETLDLCGTTFTGAGCTQN